MLNPETNSDSDSLKSKGARWVSAKVQISHKGNPIKYKKEDIFLKELILYPKIKAIRSTRVVLKTTS